MKIAGLPVVDAIKPINIFITAKDIAKSNRKNPGACAAAQACLRVPSCTQARVHLGRTYILVGKKWQRTNTPAPLRTEIISFDRGAPFQPGRYTLLPPSPCDRVGARVTGKQQGSDKTKKTGKKKTRTKRHIVVGVRSHGWLDNKRG